MERAIKRMEKMEKEAGVQRERNLCKSDCKIPDGNSGALISRLCWSLDSNRLLPYPFCLFSFLFFFFSSFRNAVLGYIRFVRVKKCVRVRVLLNGGGFRW